jgi:hypothetical protein
MQHKTRVKAAYRTLAKKYHPDVNDAPNATAFFRLIQEAYETLSVPSKREQYDYDRTNEQAGPPEEPKEYSGYTYVYNPDAVPAESERRKDIPIVDSLLAIALVITILYGVFHIHPAISTLLGIAFAVVLAVLFQTRVGWWIISIIYSAIWATLGGALVYSLAKGDWIWFWTSSGVIFLLSLAQIDTNSILKRKKLYIHVSKKRNQFRFLFLRLEIFLLQFAENWYIILYVDK